MKTMTSADIRQGFLNYFRGRDHHIVTSASLVPVNDPTLLFTNAGMNQFKDVFLGTERRDYRRATTAQKCMRVSGKHNDLNTVGPSLRHHTFFEMLGNFSFGDYFKTDAIPFAWELLTEVWHLPSKRLYATIFKGDNGIPRDDEAYAIWQTLLPDARIKEMGVSENFWAMGDTGPCGRCSEVHYHRGDHLPCSAQTCLGIDCNCDRYVEIWNNVFMEFDRQPDGSLSPLPAPSIDTGMGLERVVSLLQGTLSNYDTDLFTPLLGAISQRASTPYGPLSGKEINDTTDVSLRVIADHLRAMTFLIADGVVPSNEWRGYVLRKIMRRAMRHGKKLGLIDPFLHDLVNVVVTEMGSAYPELETNKASIIRTVRREEEQFDNVLTDGLPRLEAALSVAESGPRILRGDEAFRLYDTFGLPLDFIEDLASTRQVQVDRTNFDKAMEAQRSRARANSRFAADETIAFVPLDGDDPSSITETFVGYNDTTSNSTVAFLFRTDGTGTETLGTGEDGYAVLNPTPFYLESGGQVSDEGSLTADGITASVRDVARTTPAWPRMHVVTVTRGVLNIGTIVSAKVDVERRNAIRRNHTATHLLHAALRDVVGTHVKQAGSLVAPDRLRFDISHYEPIAPNQVADVERIVNSHIIENRIVDTQERLTEDAIADGAIALFGEKYGDHVRVVSVAGFSVELCGGTHCRATGDIGPFLVTHEGGVAAGVRRIEAVTGDAAVQLLQERRAILDTLLHALGTTGTNALAAVKKLQADTKRLSRNVEQLKVKAAMGTGSPGATGNADTSVAGDVVKIDGVKLMVRRVSGLEQGALRVLADSLRERLGSGVVVLAADTDGKAALVVTVSKDLTGQIHAGNLVKTLAPIVGGQGGGRSDFAQAGGRQVERIDEIVPESRAAIKRMLAN